jgi:hypothetical protein
LRALSARRNEDRRGDRTLRVRAEVFAPAPHYLARSQSGQGAYQIDHTATGWVCACDGYRFTGCFKHVAGVERRAEREGWTFGTTARNA